MMIRNSFFSILFIFFCFFSTAASQNFSSEQSNKYWIFFTDKNGVSFNPLEYFDAKTIENRIRQNIPIYDSTDFPANEIYLAEVKKNVDSVSYYTRWLNAVAVFANENQIEKIKSFAFVKEVAPMFFTGEIAEISSEIYDTILNSEKEFLLAEQTNRMGIKEFETQNIDGRGIRIAVFDAGFPAVDTSPAFEHLRRENRIVKTFDFVKNKDFVYSHNAHGTNVLSCIAGKIGEKKIGLATGAEFLLARTEMANREPFAEEEYWLAAAEWADKNGANIISSSLAYTYHRYFQKEMNGKKSLVAKAANIAASKGILVVNAAGNDGKNQWKIIATPADADSVLAVGGINPQTDFHIYFSSFGPTADKRMKPNVCAFGHVVAAGKKGLETAYGTSFAAPLVAGFAACAWQLNRNLTNMELFKEIEKSGDLFPYYDYAHGFGVPQAKYFTDSAKENPMPTFEFKDEKYSLKIIIKNEFLNSSKKEFASFKNAVDEEIKNQHSYLYYHIENEKGYLDKYYVLKAEQQEVLELNKENFSKGQKIQVFYKGYSETFNF